ncbi:hypothetical protein PIB30_093238 [Stylosanthes scabra]|uniref:Uncharacterized protein n=1 Tax=Stylosanthes scabra TaxID=79078 RepID=A0ABU6YSP4_9FABA|nr:hypothetical protein [Stylosanthes scabra]
MSTDHRLLRYMLSYVWLPRRGNHGAIIEDDLIILWAMVKRIRLNWPYLIAWHLMDYTTHRSVNTGLGHGLLLTKIFEHFCIDLSGEEAIFVDDGSAITSRHLNKMGRGPKGAVEENVDADEEGPHPQGVGMDRRLDGCESRLSNRAKEIQELGNDVHRFFSRAAQSEDQGFQDGAPDQE